MSFKDFLGWLQSDEEPKSQREPAPRTWQEKRKENRVDLEPERRLTVYLQAEAGGSAPPVIADVKNISVRGCGLVFATKEERGKVGVGQRFVGSLAVDDFPIPLNVEVIRFVGETGAAIRFRPPFPRELEKLERFLEPRCLGRSLREIDPKILQAAAEKADTRPMRWFQGVNETNLFTWVDPASKKIVQQQLVFLEKVIEWKEGAPLRTGQIQPDHPDAGKGMGYVKAELLDFDAMPDLNLVNMARTLVESSRIDADIKAVFLERIAHVG